MSLAAQIFDVVGMAVIFLGIFILLVSAIGLYKLPDVYLRTSSLGTSAGLGVACIVIGALCTDFSWPNLIKAIIAVVAQMLASAVGSMAIARTAYQNQSLPADITWLDELRRTQRAEDDVTEPRWRTAGTARRGRLR